MLRHIVMWKFQEGCQAQMHEFLDALAALREQIPELLDMQIGVSCVKGNSHDAVLRADFEDEAAMVRYKNDPRHVAVAQMCRPICVSRVDLDYEI